MYIRLFFVFIILFSTVSAASAINILTPSTITKDNSHILMNQARDREGGEDMASAVFISAIPFFDTGCDAVPIDAKPWKLNLYLTDTNF